MNLRRLILTITTLAISLLASSQLVVAAEEVHEHHEMLRDYSEEVRRLARERVQAATSSGALGHGVPILNTWTDMNLVAVLLAIVAVGAGVAILYHALKKNRNIATSMTPSRYG
jgi:hypothetical protein